MKMYCPNCGKIFKPEVELCPGCGWNRKKEAEEKAKANLEAEEKAKANLEAEEKAKANLEMVPGPGFESYEDLNVG